MLRVVDTDAGLFFSALNIGFESVSVTIERACHRLPDEECGKPSQDRAFFIKNPLTSACLTFTNRAKARVQCPGVLCFVRGRNPDALPFK